MPLVRRLHRLLRIDQAPLEVCRPHRRLLNDQAPLDVCRPHRRLQNDQTPLNVCRPHRRLRVDQAPLKHSLKLPIPKPLQKNLLFRVRPLLLYRRLLDQSDLLSLAIFSWMNLILRRRQGVVWSIWTMILMNRPRKGGLAIIYSIFCLILIFLYDSVSSILYLAYYTFLPQQKFPCGLLYLPKHKIRRITKIKKIK